MTIAASIRSFNLLLTLALLAACAKTGAPAAAPPGVVRFDLAKDPTTLNPLFIQPDASLADAQVARLVYEPFVDLDAHGHPVPVLLTRIPSRANGDLSADGRTIVYHLRRNVRWSDGSALTSADVLYTLREILDPRNPVRTHEGYELIDRASAPDAHTVVLHLRRAWAPAVLTYFSYGIIPQVVLPAHLPLARVPAVGDGPFDFVSWSHGNMLTYRANPLYWRGKPAIDRLEVRIVPDTSTNLLLLQSGALDWNLIAPAQRSIAARDPDVRLYSTPTAVIAALVFNTARAPLDDVRVRRAIAMSIDRGLISAKITLGAYPVTDMLQPQFSWAYDPAIHEPAYDPHAADALLDAAGWKRGPRGMRERGGVPLRLTYVQFPESVTGVHVAAAVQAMLRRRGIDVSVESISNAQLFLPVSGILAAGRFDLAYVPFTMGADPDDSDVLACKAPSNYMRWCDPRVDALERVALASVSQQQRRRLYGEIARRVAAQVPLLYLFNARYVYAYRDRLHGFAPNAFLPTWNAWAWKT
ncbi:MAG TPA: peptide ABC transporter substrate-binding protein [Candidatus Baltobacteraceae bacterium]|nr:peptide ABC transporter substrate-binding protein [Candidatus Baltobacteraceae bacterium]